MEIYVPITIPEQLLQGCKSPEVQLEVYADLVEKIISQDEVIAKCDLDIEAIKEINNTNEER